MLWSAVERLNPQVDAGTVQIGDASHVRSETDPAEAAPGVDALTSTVTRERYRPSRVGIEPTMTSPVTALTPPARSIAAQD